MEQDIGADNQSQASVERTAETRRGVIRWLVRETLGCVLVAVALFASAGAWGWGMGWALVAIYATWTASSAVVLVPRNPELLAERASRKQDVARWDAKLLSVVGVSTLAKYVLAGLDRRYGWSAGVPALASCASLVLSAAGYALMTWAMMSNAFFATVNRIQKDRGHAVTAVGPYGYVRHPAYLGTLVAELLVPVMLGSWWALIPGAINAVLIVIRTGLEDAMLLRELPEYAAYADRTRHRLVPGLW